MTREEHIAATIEDTITAILESEVAYNPDFDKCEVLAEVAKDAHINLLLAKHKRNRQATTGEYEIFFAKHEKAVKGFFAGVFHYYDKQAGKA